MAVYKPPNTIHRTLSSSEIGDMTRSMCGTGCSDAGGAVVI
jgi:hypothetical protein